MIKFLKHDGRVDSVAKQRIYVNEDGSKAVPEGHKDAAFLLAGVGGDITKSAAEKYGIKDGVLVQVEAVEDSPVEETPADKRETKVVKNLTKR